MDTDLKPASPPFPITSQPAPAPRLDCHEPPVRRVGQGLPPEGAAGAAVGWFWGSRLRFGLVLTVGREGEQTLAARGRLELGAGAGGGIAGIAIGGTGRYVCVSG